MGVSPLPHSGKKTTSETWSERATRLSPRAGRVAGGMKSRGRPAGWGTPPRSNAVGTLLPRPRGGVLPRTRVRKAPGSPACFASEFLCLRRLFTGGRIKGKARGGAEVQSLENKPNKISADGVLQDSLSLRGCWHGSFLPFRLKSASPGVPAPLAGGQGDPSHQCPVCPAGREPPRGKLTYSSWVGRL